ncbi:MAG: glycoside hydrolase family 2 TIM barrel-domain containing protein [Bacteroidales bacterium]
MKYFLSLVLLLQFILIQSSAQIHSGFHEKINDQWKFRKGDHPEAALPGFNDNRWRTLDLPHDWSVEGPYSPDLASATGYLPGGIAWYRKTLHIPENQTGNTVYLYFEGIYRNGEVFVNGKSPGMRPNGYISYYYDITPFIRFGEDNTLAVRVDHSQYADSRWYTGSGIYRNVYMVYAHPVHISPWGLYITTPSVTEKEALMEVQTTLQNTSGKNEIIRIVHRLETPEGNTVASTSSRIRIPAEDSTTLTRQLKVKQPRLWSVDDPYLYSLHTELYLGNKSISHTVQPTGIRTLAFDPDLGFFLNGKNMKVKGVCLHHDAGCLGAAVPKEVWKRRLLTLKSLGCNAIRTSHNPQAPDLYNLCDELGLLVLNEAFDEWEFPKKKWLDGWNVGEPGFQGHAEFFEEWGEKDLRDMILRDRNHPSVFMWSIGNEVDYPNDPYSHPILDREGIRQQHTHGYLPNQPDARRLGDIARRLAAVVKTHDPSRPVTAGLAGPVMSNETDYPDALDVVGYNYNEYRYEQDHAAYPDRVLYGSETGHSLESWKAVSDNDYIFGQFLWTGINYLGEAHAWPSRGFTSGLLDLAGFIKPRGWFRKSLWSDEPMIYLGTYPVPRGRRSDYLSIDAPPVWNYEAGDTIRVVAYTNCPEARLLLNGKQAGEIRTCDNQTGIIYWDIPFEPGKLEAAGIRDGRESARFTVATSKRPHTIRAEVINPVVARDKGIAHIKIRIMDEDGNPVFLSDNEITCTVEGPARLLGLEASDPRDMGNYTDHVQRVYQGNMLAYIQATGEAGTARITFASPWLQPAVVEVRME